MQEDSHRFTERRERMGREGDKIGRREREKSGGGEAYLLKANIANVHRILVTAAEDISDRCLHINTYSRSLI